MVCSIVLRGQNFRVTRWLLHQKPWSWNFRSDSQKNLNNPKFDIQPPLSNWVKSCELHHTLATWCVFNVTEKSNWQYCTTSTCTHHFLSSCANYRVVRCDMQVWASNTNSKNGYSPCFSHNCNAVNSDVIQSSKLWLQRKQSVIRPALFKFIRHGFLFHTVWCVQCCVTKKKKKRMMVRSITAQKSDFPKLPVLHIRNAHWSWNFRSQTSPTSGSH